MRMRARDTLWKRCPVRCRHGVFHLLIFEQDAQLSSLFVTYGASREKKCKAEIFIFRSFCLSKPIHSTSDKPLCLTAKFASLYVGVPYFRMYTYTKTQTHIARGRRLVYRNFAVLLPFFLYSLSSFFYLSFFFSCSFRSAQDERTRAGRIVDPPRPRGRVRKILKTLQRDNAPAVR